MSGFLDGLARRALGVETTLQPLVASRFSAPAREPAAWEELH